VRDLRIHKGRTNINAILGLYENERRNKGRKSLDPSKNRTKIFRTIHNTKSGNRLNMHINAALIEYEGKQAILTQHRDISDVRQAEAKIRLLAQTITSAKDYISITALDNTILFVNDAFAEGHGYTAQELIGVDFSLVISPLTPKEKIEQISAAGIQGSWNGEIFTAEKTAPIFRRKCGRRSFRVKKTSRSRSSTSRAT